MAKSRYTEIYYRKIKKGPTRNVYLERFFEYLEGSLRNYGLDTCCLLFPLRKGLLIIGYFNIFLNTILLIGAATGTLSPLFMKIQYSLWEESSPSFAVAMPATEIAFFVVLLCATHRNDVGLLRFYMAYCCVVVALTIVSYAIVMFQLSMLFIFALFASVAYQLYILLLVRSLIVKIRQAKCEVRMMSLKDLLNRRDIDVEAPVPVHRPVPKDLGPGPLAAIVGNPKVEIVVKTEPTVVNADKTLGEIKRDTDIMVEEVKKSNIDIVVKNNEAIGKLMTKDSTTEIKVEKDSIEEEPKGKTTTTLNAKLKFLGMKKTETKSKQLDKLNTENDNELKEDSKDKVDKKPKKTIFGSKSIDTHDKSIKKTVDKEINEKQQTTDTKEKSKDKKDGKQKKTIFGVKIKDSGTTEDTSSRNEPAPGSAESEDSKPEAKNDKDVMNQNSNKGETEGKVGTKMSNNDVENMTKAVTVQTTNQKETKPTKIKKKIQKERTSETDEMEEIKLDVDPEKERTGVTKLATIEEEPKRKWFWKK